MSLTDDYLKARNNKSIPSTTPTSRTSETFTKEYLEAKKTTASAPAPVRRSDNSTAGAKNNKQQSQRKPGEINALGAGDYGAGKKDRVASTIGAAVTGWGSGMLKSADLLMGSGTGELTMGESIRAAREGVSQQQLEAEKRTRQQDDPLYKRLDEKYQEYYSDATEDLGFWGQLLVDAGINLGQMGLDALTGPASLFTMGVRAGGGRAIELENEGYGENKQLLGGFTSGAIEALTERIAGPFEKIYGKTLAGSATKKIIERLGKSTVGKAALSRIAGFIGEGAEEVLSDLLNPLVDKAIGVNKNDGIYDDDWLETWAYDFLVGGVLGGIGAEGQILSGDLKAARDFSSADSQRALVESGLESASDTESYKRAQKANTILDKGKELTGRQINRLQQANESAIIAEDEAKIKESVKQRLNELGETADAEKLADVIAKQSVGKAVTPFERNLVAESAYGPRVVNELSPAGIDAGTFSNDWAQRLGTNQINPEQYGRLLAEANAEQDAETAPQIDFVPPELQEPEQPQEISAEDTNVSTSSPTEIPADSVTAAETQPEIAPQATEAAPSTEAAPDIDSYANKYGDKKAKAVKQVYALGDSSADVQKFGTAFDNAYEWGKSGVPLSYILRSPALSDLNEAQRKLAWQMGSDSAKESAAKRGDKIEAGKKTGNVTRRKGVVRSEKGESNLAALRKSFNDRQKIAYKVLSAYAEATGVDIVLYSSKTDANGDFADTNGAYAWKSDAIYIDVNAGLDNIKDVSDLGKYTMLRTFGHEFTHFIEKWNPVQYNEFRGFVFETLEAKGEDIDLLIEEQKSRDSSGRMSTDEASREVIADAMADILPDTDLIEQLANEHRTVFEKLLEKLEEFVADIKAFFKGITVGDYPGARALKAELDGEIKYLDDIVSKWTELAKTAVENYQMTVGEIAAVAENTVSDLSDVWENASQEGKDEIIQAISENTKGPSRMYPTEIRAQEYTSEETDPDIEDKEQISEARQSSSDVIAKNDIALKIIKQTGKKYKSFTAGIDKMYFAGSGICAARIDLDTFKSLFQTVDKPDISAKPLFNAINSEKNVKFAGKAYTYLSGKNQIKSVLLDDGSGVQHLVNEKYAKYFDGYDFYCAPEANTPIVIKDSAGNAIGVIMPMRADNPINTEKLDLSKMRSFNKTEAAQKKAAESKIKGENENGPETVDGGRGDIRGGSSGRGMLQETSAVSEQRSDTERNSNSGNARVSVSEEESGGNEARRNGQADSNGNRDGLLSGSDERRAGTANGNDNAGISDNVPVKKRTKQNKNNYRITEDIDSIRPNYQDNLAAIKLLKQLEAENRKATAEERAVLAKYKGWGGLKDAILGWRGNELRRILTEKEFEAAKDSILNAHYTSTKVISGIYKAVERMGFKGGSILEPSMGVGNFFGMLPKNLSDNSSLYGVELDSITGQIAKHLYPDAKIDVAGFQDVLYPDDTFDLVVGNVPFSNDIKLSYRGESFNLHDFFFVKALDETKPGGVLALITSTGTLDKLSGKTQAAIAKRANLVAAFRLPDDAFKQNAGTSVTTDLIFLQKKGDGIEDNGVSFRKIGTIDGIPINEYYVDHPENILGELAREKNMYAQERTVVHATANFTDLFDKAIKSLPKNIIGETVNTASPVKAKRRGEVQRAHFAVTENGVELINGDGTSETLSGKNADKAKSFVEIKSLFSNIADTEKSGNVDAANEYRKRLNTAYDSFVKKYGTLKKNENLLKKDDDYVRLGGLEIVDRDGATRKSAIFTQPTMYKAPRTSAASSSEALSMSLNDRGKVDLGYIASLTGKSVEDAAAELSDDIILTPDGEYVLIPQYVSGNIYKKLEALNGKTGFDRNRELLSTAIPTPKKASEIDAEISSHWIPETYMQQFIKEKMNLYYYVKVHYIKETGQWDLGKFGTTVSKYSTKYVDAHELLINTMNNRNVVVRDKLSDGSYVLNKAETEIAQNKQNDLRRDFREWIFKDEARRKEIESVFNRTMNANAPLDFKTLSEKLDFGISPTSKIELRDYQKEAVARIVFGGNTLLHHGVGTGKTATMIAAAHVLKETGTANKPMFVVPNGKVEDFKNEILGMYPSASILALSDKQMTPAELQRTKAIIATNNWDYVLIYRTAFQKIGISDMQKAAFIQEQLDDLDNAIREAKGDEYGKLSTRAEKGLISRKKNLEEKLKTITDKPKDTTTTFEDMGIDALFIDEAHNFKKVGFATTHDVSGVDSESNQITTDLYLKERYMRNTGGRIILATATPLTNTISEMYNMTLHVAPDILREAGIYSFDAWLNTFGDMRSEWEIAPDGKTYRQKERIQSFKNGNELIGLYRQFADVKQTKDVVKDLPEAKTVTVVSEGDDIHEALLNNFASRYGKPHSYGEAGSDSIIVINNDARAAATDIRLVYHALLRDMFPGTSIEDFDLPSSKINRAVENIVDEYNSSKKQKGTQFVFLDQGINANGKRYKFNLYEDLINKLVENGIPREEIANIGDYDGEIKRTELYDKMNSGVIRVLIGSTQKMGEGVNAQNKAVALHHLSVPYRPDNLEQREGRIVRHGNENKDVRIYKYIQEKSYDSYLWQMIERKSKYVAQALNGGDATELEDNGDVTVNAREAKAIATGDPRILEKFKLEDDVKKLRTLERAFYEENRSAERNIVEYNSRLSRFKKELSAAEAMAKTIKKNRTDDFRMKIGGSIFDKRSEAAQAFNERFFKDKKSDVGEVFGLKIIREVEYSGENVKYYASIGGYRTALGDSPDGNITRVLNLAASLENKPAELKARITQLESAISDAEETAARTVFPQAKELQEKSAELSKINEALGIKSNEVSIDVTTADDDNVQRSRRAKNEEYDTNGVHWLYETGEVSDGDIRFVWEAIANISKRNYNSYVKTYNSEYIVDNGNKIFFISADYQSPYVSKLIVIADTYETNMEQAKELIRNAKGHPSRHRDALQIARNKYGEGYISEYTSSDYRTNARQNGAGERTDSGRSDREDQFRRNQITDSDAEFSRRVRSLSNREILSMAVDQIPVDNLTDGQKDALRIYRGKLDKLEDLTSRREALGGLYREQMFTKGGDRKSAPQTKSMMDELDTKISAAQNDLFELENKDVLKRIAVKARGVIETEERARAKERLDKYRENRDEAAAVKKYREKVRVDVQTLQKWLLRPNNKVIRQHIPAEIQKSVVDFLDGIDFSSKRLLSGGEATKADKLFIKRMQKVRDAISSNASLDMYSGYYDLAPNFLENFQVLIDKIQADMLDKSGMYVVNNMSAAELKSLHDILKGLKKFITGMNTFHNNAMFEHADEAGESTVEHLSKIGKGKERRGLSERINNFMVWQNMRPAYAFERFGKGGISIFDEFRRGQAEQAFLAKKIIAFSEDAYTADEAKKWSEEIKTFEIDGKEVKIPVTSIMSLYCLSKRKQALTHILSENGGEGIRISNFTGEDNKSVRDAGHIISESTLTEIIDTLTERQIAVADKLQRYMSDECSKWGNYVSRARFDVDIFGEENYFPINSDGRHLAATADENPDNAGLYALLNMGFTKELQENATNRIVIYNIFDVFANHAASMAQYRSFALPVLDALKWFNYKNDHTSVRDQMAKVYGSPIEEEPGSGTKGYAEQFVINLIRAYNGTEAHTDIYEGLALKTIHRFNRQAVAYNARVVIQQPLAITRASMLISPALLSKGLAQSATNMKALAEEMEAHSGIAAWKSLGFYDTNISRGLTQLIKHDETAADKIIDAGMKGAELADRYTWAAMWYACKETVDRSKYSNEESYFDAVTDLFESVIYKTQVVDSIMTKSDFLRKKSVFARTFGSFMSEPMTTMSMLTDAYVKLTEEVQRGVSLSQAWQKQKGNIGKLLTVYAVGQALLAAVESISDAWRDDDDFETFMQKYLAALKKNVIDELLPFGKIPIASDFYALIAKGYSLGVSWTQWAEYLGKAFDILWRDKIRHKKDTNYTTWGGIYNALRGISSLVGLPFATASREVIDLWNNTIGSFTGKKLKTYDAGMKSNIKYAYQDGNLTADEAMDLLLDKGLAKDEDDAYWTVQGWSSGDDHYSKYGSLKDGISAGDSGAVKEALPELKAHGVEDKDIKSSIASTYKEAYIEGDTETRKKIVDGMTATGLYGSRSEVINYIAEHWLS